MNRLRNLCFFWMMVLALSPSFSVAALKSKPAPQFPDSGAALNVSDWSFRKSVVISNSGPQQLERQNHESCDVVLPRGGRK